MDVSEIGEAVESWKVEESVYVGEVETEDAVQIYEVVDIQEVGKVVNALGNWWNCRYWEVSRIVKVGKVVKSWNVSEVIVFFSTWILVDKNRIDIISCTELKFWKYVYVIFR